MRAKQRQGKCAFAVNKKKVLSVVSNCLDSVSLLINTTVNYFVALKLLPTADGGEAAEALRFELQPVQIIIMTIILMMIIIIVIIIRIMIMLTTSTKQHLAGLGTGCQAFADPPHTKPTCTIFNQGRCG